MSLNRETLVNIVVFMNRAAEGGGIKSAIDAMAFAETAQALDAEIKAIDAAKKEGEKE